MARFDDEQDDLDALDAQESIQYNTRSPRRRTEGPAAHEIGSSYSTRAPRPSKQTDKVQSQRPSSRSTSGSIARVSPRSSFQESTADDDTSSHRAIDDRPRQSSKATQSARQRIEYERYGRIRPQSERERLQQLRKERGQSTQRPPRDFHTDENPDVPKIRRASLHQDAPILLPEKTRPVPPKTTRQVPIIEIEPELEPDQNDDDYDNQDEVFPEEVDALDEPEAPPQRATRSVRPARPVSPLRPTRPPATYDDDEDEYGDEFPSRRRPVRHPYTPPVDLDYEPVRRTYGARRVRTTGTTGNTTAQHIPQTRGAYARRGRHEHVAYTQRVRSFLSIIQDVRHNRPLLITISVALLALVLLPVLINSITHSADSTTGTITGVGQSGQSGSGQPTLNRPPVDPHELVITPPESDHPAPPVLATSAYLLDADTGATLYAYNPFLHLPMMSTTKLMTATLAIEHGNLDQRVTINGQIASDLNQLSADSSVMGIKRGETYTLRDLMYGLMLVSGNDAAIAIADTIGGNLPHFVTMMNQKAQQLGLHDTHYTNPHGLLADGHYSSAHDLALLGRYSFNIPQVQQISATRTYSIPQTVDHPKHNMFNGDQFLWWYPGVNAGKPGWDGGSNFVQVVSVVRNGHHLIGVTMHTADWWTDMRDLMNWGFNTFQWVSPAIVDKQSPIPYDSLWNYFARDKQGNTIPTADGGRYYVYTGYSISGPIMTYFDQHGGLNAFGYPTGLPGVSGSNAVRQTFSHATIQCDLGTNRCGTI